MEVAFVAFYTHTVKALPPNSVLITSSWAHIPFTRGHACLNTPPLHYGPILQINAEFTFSVILQVYKLQFVTLIFISCIYNF